MKSPGLCPELSPADLCRVEAARGFLELGLPDDAWDELEQVAPAARADAAVLALRVEVYLVKGMVSEARIVATGAIRMHPEAGGCHYALALTEVAAGNLPAAKEALAVAFTAAPELRAAALDDDRLREFWRTLGGVSPTGLNLAIPAKRAKQRR